MNWLILLLMFAQPEPRPVPHEIRLPEVQSPTPPPLPPNAVQTLNYGQYYVIDSDVECFLRASPNGLLDIAAVPGPLHLPTKLLVEGGKGKFKTFSGKYLYVIEAFAPTDKTTGRVDLLIIPKGVATDKEILQRSIEANRAPQPPPVPPKPPDPVPPPKPPGPGPNAKLAFLMIVDPATAPPNEGRVVGDLDFWESLKAKGHLWRRYSPTDTATITQLNLAKHITAAGGAPCLIVEDGDGKVWSATKLPDTTDGVLKIMNDLTGGK